MKIIITESQFKMLTEATSLADDSDFRETIKSYENEVVDGSGKHYVFDDRTLRTQRLLLVPQVKKEVEL